MQAGIKSFDLPISPTSTDGRKIVAAGTKKAEAPASDKLSGFMEIMATLMALPPEQWENSLAKLDKTFEGDSALLDSRLDLDQLDDRSAEFMALFLNFNGSIQKELQNTEAQDTANVLLGMAKAFIDDPDAFASCCASDEDGFKDWKAKWFHLDNREIMDVPAGNTQQGDVKGKSPVSLSAQNQIIENADGGHDPLQLPADSELDSGDTALLNATPLEEVAKKNARHLSRLADQPVSVKADLSQATGDQITKNTTFNSSGKEQQVGIEVSNPLAAGKFAAGHLQSDSISEEIDPDADARSLDGLSGQKSSLSSAGHNGPLSRLDLRPDQAVVQVTGDKEVAPQDKALQSDVIRQIVQRMSMHTQGGQSKMVIHLKPEYLGNVHMQVLTENHQVTVRMMADSLGVKEIVEQNLQHLRAEMQHHGLEIQKFDVFVANDNEGWKNGREQAGFRESLRQKKQRFDSGKAKLNLAKSISNVGLRKPYNQKNINEIDYFA